jgi:hypothetical protein
LAQVVVAVADLLLLPDQAVVTLYSIPLLLVLVVAGVVEELLDQTAVLVVAVDMDLTLVDLLHKPLRLDQLDMDLQVELVTAM